MEYNFRYTLTKEELVELTVYGQWRAPWQRKARRSTLIRLIVSALVVFGFFIYYLQQVFPSKGTPYFLSCGGIALLYVCFTIIHWRNIPRHLKKKVLKEYHKEENQHILGESEVDFDDYGFTKTNAVGRSVHKWSAVMRFVATDRSFYFYINSLQALVVPKRIFQSPAEQAAFDKYVSAKVPLEASFRSLNL